MKERNTSKFHVDGKPPLREALPLGLQHLMAMIVGNMVPAILISSIVGLDQSMSTMLIQGAMLVAGLATYLQLYPIPFMKGLKFGSRLPVIMGTSYVFLGACLSVAGQYGLPALFGAQIGGAIIVFFVGFAVKKIRKIFTPVISGTIVSCMGLGLFPVAIKNLAGGVGSPGFGDPINFLVGAIVAAIIILLMKFGKGLIKDAAILIGIVFGYLISLGFGLVDFSAVAGTSLVSLPTPLAFGLEFRLDLIIMFAVIYIIAIADIMGAACVATFGAMDRDVTDEELASAVIGNAVTSIIASVFGSIPTGIFSQNTAIVAMNKVTSRFVISIAAFVLVLVGVSPMLGALITTIPACVVGGATLVVFSSITMAGFDIINIEGFTPENNLIAGVAIATSIGLTTVPEVLAKFPEIIVTVVGDSSIVSGAVIALLLKYIFSFKSSNKATNQ